MKSNEKINEWQELENSTCCVFDKVIIYYGSFRDTMEETTKFKTELELKHSKIM